MIVGIIILGILLIGLITYNCINNRNYKETKEPYIGSSFN